MALRRQLYDDAPLAHIDDLPAELGGKGADSSEVSVLQLEELRRCQRCWFRRGRSELGRW